MASKGLLWRRRPGPEAGLHAGLDAGLDAGPQPGRFIWHEVGWALMYESQATSERKP